MQTNHHTSRTVFCCSRERKQDIAQRDISLTGHAAVQKDTTRGVTVGNHNAQKDRDCVCGLLHYRQWWERHEVQCAVGGQLVTGTPIASEQNTLRVINRDYSYFIPLEKIDYIRTDDGLNHH